MKYEKTSELKNGKMLLLRNAEASDCAEVLEVFCATHAETDYLLSYPDEISFTAEQEADFLRSRAESACEIEILAFVDGRIAGMAGIESVGACYKVRHRAGFGISVLREFWGMGIGRALTEACIECAAKAGYTQLELEVDSQNDSAVGLYRSIGFAEYGCNPRGMKSRVSGYRKTLLMRMELD